MSEVKYKYFLLKNCWLARLEKNHYCLEPKEFFKDGKWQYDDHLNLQLNDCMMDRGDSSVFDFDEISEEEALEQIKLSNIILSEKQISDAKECYLFGDKMLYIVVDKDSDVVVFNLESKHWSKRKADSLWDSLDFDPTVFIRISSDEAIKMICSADESEERVSKKKAVELFDNGILDSLEPGKFESLNVIHKHLFDEIYHFAGVMCTVNIAKGNFRFAPLMYLEASLENIDKMPQTTFDEIIEKYVEMNIAHPFREGNGRSTRIWLDLILKKEIGMVIDWSKVDKEDYLLAMERSPIRDIEIKHILKNALTDKINDRDVFMKGIDHSYYYEGYTAFKA